MFIPFLPLTTIKFTRRTTKLNNQPPLLQTPTLVSDCRTFTENLQTNNHDNAPLPKKILSNEASQKQENYPLYNSELPL